MHNIQRSSERGQSELGWLHSRFSFSFADYFNPERMGFGALRVLNDDTVEPKSGFGKHHHEHMEIITIMLSGALAHEDDMGNKYEVGKGEVQVMTAGTGVNHSEWNHGEKEEAKLLQIWIIPNERSYAPRYEQKIFNPQLSKNNFQVLVSGKKEDTALFIHQDAVISRAELEAGKSLEYKVRSPLHGVYVFIIEGEVCVNQQSLASRDAMEISKEEKITFEAKSRADVLVIEVLMIT